MGERTSFLKVPFHKIKHPKKMLVVLFVLLGVVSAYPEDGLSASIKVDQDHSSSSWEKIKEWDIASNSPGQYQRGLYFDADKSSIAVKKSGLYYISTHILLANLTNKDVSIAVVVNDDFLNGMVLHGTAQVRYRTNIDVFGFLKLAGGDRVTVYGYCATLFKIYKDSSLSFRFHDFISSAPGFLFSLANPIELQKSDPATKLLGGWVVNDYGQFSSLSTFRQKDSIFQVALSGMYMISANILVTLLEYSEEVRLNLYVNDTVVMTTYHYLSAVSTITLNFNEIINIESNSHVAIKLVKTSSRVNIHSTSTYSLLLIQPNGFSSNRFHANLNMKYDISLPTDFVKISPWIPDTNQTIDFMDFPSSTILDDKDFGVEVLGLYYVTTHLLFTVEFNVEQSHGNMMSVALYNANNNIFMKTSVQTAVQGPINVNNISTQVYSVNLGGAFMLTPAQPLSIAFKGAIGNVVILKTSSFSVMEILSSYPGIFATLSQLTNIDTGDKVVVKNWKTVGPPGLYDFTKSMNTASGEYKATKSGVYLVTANIIVQDVDTGGIVAFISKDMLQLDDAFYFKDANPVLKMSVSLGGFVMLEEGEKQSLFLHAKDDTDWTIFRASLSAAFMGVYPNYFQAKLTSDVSISFVNSKNVVITEWSEISSTKVLKDGVYNTPFSGVYFTTAAVVLDGAHTTSPGAYYKLYIAVNDVEVPGLYSRRYTENSGSQDNSPVYTLFVSGSFYVEKEHSISIKLESGVEKGFIISDASRWGVVYMPHNELSSGALAILSSDTNFPTQSTWQNVGLWTYTNSRSNGQYEQTETLNFEDSRYVYISQEGMYVISTNIEIAYSGTDMTTFKLAVVVNDDDGVDNGMTQWHKTKYRKQTIHLCGTVFLRAKDTVALRFSTSSADFLNFKILMPSGFSFLRIPESDQPTSFAANLKNNVIITDKNKDVADWQFSGSLSTQHFDTRKGVVSVRNEGMFLMTGTLRFDNMGEYAEGVEVSLTVNQDESYTFTFTLQSSNDSFTFSEILHLKTNDFVKINASAIYDTKWLQSEYELFLNKSNSTNVTIVNPYDMIQVTLEARCSSISLIYLKDYKPSKSSEGKFAMDRSFMETGPLQPWKFTLAPTLTGQEAFAVDSDGIYIMKSKISVVNITGSVRISFVTSDEQTICSSVHVCKSKCFTTLNMNCFAKFLKGVFVPMKITIDQPGVVIKKNSERIISKVSSQAVGGAVSLNNSIKFSIMNNVWDTIGAWSEENTEYGLFAEKLFIYNDELIIHTSGSYQIAANLLLNVECGLSCYSSDVEFGLFIDNKLYQTLCKTFTSDDNITTTTVNIFASASLLKWNTLSIKVRAQWPIVIEVLQGSTFSTVLLELPPFTRVTDLGPLTMSNIMPDLVKTSVMGISKTWTCQAYADGLLTYIWYKDGKIVKSENGSMSEFTIAGYINDTGKYQCVAELDSIRAPTNMITVDIYDINECELNIHDCSVRATCVNTPGSFQCVCNAGFVGDGRNCTDENECTTGNHNCHVDADCINVNRTYECDCKDGFFGNGIDMCNDINECHEKYIYMSNCSSLATCENSQGGFNCTCNQGYRGDGYNCTDENECVTGNFDCDPNAHCRNLNGTYDCICNGGYTGNGKSCEDIDECSPPHNLTLRETGLWRCVKNAICVNEIGGYDCACQSGFVGNGTQECSDVNECVGKPCNAQADCRNYDGGYQCSCRDGWQGDGYQCSDIDDCALDSTNECENGNCTNTVGGYLCECFAGYRQNGRTCVVDSATVAKQLDACEQDSSSFKCLCNDPEARENNIMCNGLFVALLILVLVAIVVIIFVVKYIKKKKAMKIRPVRTHRDKYIEMGNESEL